MNKINSQYKRAIRNRKKIKKHVTSPRLSVFRSNKYLYAQIIDDMTGKTIASASSLKSKSTGLKAAEEVGKEIAEVGKKAKVTKVVFDRGGYQYHGKIKALADAARSGGLEF